MLRFWLQWGGSGTTGSLIMTRCMQQCSARDPYVSNMTVAAMLAMPYAARCHQLCCSNHLQPWLPRAVILQVPAADNYYAALNSAVFSDGSFVFVPKGVKSPMELSTYFRINASETGQVRKANIYHCLGEAACAVSSSSSVSNDSITESELWQRQQQRQRPPQQQQRAGQRTSGSTPAKQARSGRLHSQQQQQQLLLHKQCQQQQQST
jgi:hypothetical protein